MLIRLLVVLATLLLASCTNDPNKKAAPVYGGKVNNQYAEQMAKMGAPVLGSSSPALRKKS